MLCDSAIHTGWKAENKKARYESDMVSRGRSRYGMAWRSIDADSPRLTFTRDCLIIYLYLSIYISLSLYVYTYIYIYIHIHTYIHTYLPTYLHTYIDDIHIYTHIVFIVIVVMMIVIIIMIVVFITTVRRLSLAAGEPSAFGGAFGGGVLGAPERRDPALALLGASL